jgi:hypothetical protein
MWVILYVYLKDTVLMIELVYYLLINLNNLYTLTKFPCYWNSSAHMISFQLGKYFSLSFTIGNIRNSSDL